MVTPSTVIDAKLQRTPKPPGVASWKLYRSASGTKKYQVRVRFADGTRLTVHFGNSSMLDYTQSRSKSQRARFHSRYAKRIALHKDDPTSPMFYTCNLLWR